MKTGKDILLLDKRPKLNRLTLAPEEKKRLVDFFSILIEIDQKNRRREMTKNEE